MNNMNRWTIVSNELYRVLFTILISTPPEYPHCELSFRLQDIILTPSYKKAIELAIKLSEVENIFEQRKKVNKKMLINKKSSQDFIGYYEITKDIKPEKEYEELFNEIYKECRKIITGKQPEDFAKIAITLVAVLKFIQVTNKTYGEIDDGMNTPKGFFNEFNENEEEKKFKNFKLSIIQKILWIRSEDLSIINRIIELDSELLKYLKFTTNRMINRLDNSDLGEMNEVLW